MKKNLIAVIVLGLLVFGGISFFGPGTSGGAREALDQTVDEAAKKQNLTGDDKDLLRLQLAVADFTAKSGKPPAELSELVPAYFDRVPVDPKTKQPYKYKSQGDSFLLGEQVDGGQIQVASTTSADGKAADGAPLGEEGFINPNTMVIEDFVYNSEGKRDPYQPFNLAPEIDETKTPLERFGLEQLRFTAFLISGSGEPTAMVEISEGKGYPVRMGTKIGSAGGVVISIDKETVKILETTIDITGAQKQQIQELKIQTSRDGEKVRDKVKTRDKAKAKEKANIKKR